MFTIKHNDGSSASFKSPDRLPVAHDVYTFLQPLYSLAGVQYEPGDTLEIIGRTRDKPFELENSLGNLLVKCKHFPEGSVWTSIEQCINSNLIVWDVKPDYAVKLLLDPGHGWASVKLSLVKQLGIADKISRYSYMRGKSAYLEEDCDLSLLLDALRKAGFNVVFKYSHTDKRSPIRSYATYNPLA